MTSGVSDSCDPVDCSPPGSSVHGILQARILEWAAMSSSRDLSPSGIETETLMSPVLTGSFFTTNAAWASLKGLFRITENPN